MFQVYHIYLLENKIYRFFVILFILFSTISSQNIFLPNTTTFVDSLISIPLYVDYVDSLEGLEFSIEYDNSKLEFDFITFNKSQLENMNYNIEATINNNENSSEIIVLTFAGGQLFTGSGHLMYIGFNANIWYNEGTELVLKNVEVNNNLVVNTQSSYVYIYNLPGCTDITACNYDNQSDYDDGSCAYVFDCENICGGLSIYDCSGQCGGNVVIDECGQCGGDNSTCIDCAGTPNGTFITDSCGACVSEDDITCIQGCDGNYTNDGTHQLDDECGVCGGDNSTCIDCAGTPNGTFITDSCGACVSENDTTCIQGCDGSYTNDGTHLLDDECGVCGGNGSSCLSTGANIISEFSIDRVYPNPFNPVVNIDYSLSKSLFINILIYDLNGQVVDNLYSGYKSIGNHSMVWNASGFSSNAYILRLIANHIDFSRIVYLTK